MKMSNLSITQNFESAIIAGEVKNRGRNKGQDLRRKFTTNEINEMII